jgi:phytoene desaturase
MPAHPTALVIGAGLGGIAVAARLARQGYAVTVLEKNATPGGRCGQLLHEGHRFDIGPTLLLMPEVVAETYAALDARMDEHLELRRVDPTYRIHFDDGTMLALTGDLQALQAQVEAIEPGSFDGLLRYLTEGQHHYRHALQHFVGRNFTSLPAYFSPQNLREVIFHLHAFRKHYARMGRYFRHPRLKAAFTFQDMYLGLSPFAAPATYSLLPYTELADGVWFPIGGMYRLVESLVAIAEAHGVHFSYSAPVTQIIVNGNRATGVLLADGSRLDADVIVANADLPYVNRCLLPDAQAAGRLEHLHYTCSAIMFYWGVDTVYPQLGPHTVFLAGDYRAGFERIFRDHALPLEPSVYVHAPARIDPSAAPPGKDTLLALVPVGHLDDGAVQDWDGWQAHARAAVLRRLAAVGAADLDRHVTVEITYMPRDWRNQYNLARGAAFSLSHNVLQVGYLRPHNRHRRYGNLYFVGGSTHPGSGLPMVLLSARLTTERILQDRKTSDRVRTVHAGRTAGPDRSRMTAH